jgi:hypothetical protein
LGVIRWFQLQPATCTALNTGRPEEIRDLTLRSLNALGKASRVRFRSDLLWMNPYGWGQRVADSKVACIRWLQERGLRVVAVVDNEPAIIQAMAAADQTHEILFLHADTSFRVPAGGDATHGPGHHLRPRRAGLRGGAAPTGAVRLAWGER